MFFSFGRFRIPSTRLGCITVDLEDVLSISRVKLMHAEAVRTSMLSLFKFTQHLFSQKQIPHVRLFQYKQSRKEGVWDTW